MQNEIIVKGGQCAIDDPLTFNSIHFAQFLKRENLKWDGESFYTHMMSWFKMWEDFDFYIGNLKYTVEKLSWYVLILLLWYVSTKPMHEDTYQYCQYLFMISLIWTLIFNLDPWPSKSLNLNLALMLVPHKEDWFCNILLVSEFYKILLIST